jgi:hypothetical protein
VTWVIIGLAIFLILVCYLVLGLARAAAHSDRLEQEHLREALGAKTPPIRQETGLLGRPSAGPWAAEAHPGGA